MDFTTGVLKAYVSFCFILILICWFDLRLFSYLQLNMYIIIVMKLQCYWSNYRTPLENSCVTNNTAEYIGLPFSLFYAYGYIVYAIIFMQCEVLTENELKSNQIK